MLDVIIYINAKILFGYTSSTMNYFLVFKIKLFFFFFETSHQKCLCGVIVQYSYTYYLYI